MPDGLEKTTDKQVSCLSCRHRKIKCGREPDGCSNCSRAEIPCIYQLPETGVKRKRGPYKKNGLVRERELAHMLRAVEAKKDHTANQSGDHHTVRRSTATGMDSRDILTIAEPIRSKWEGRHFASGQFASGQRWHF